jgi:hypothetical protein
LRSATAVRSGLFGGSSTLLSLHSHPARTHGKRASRRAVSDTEAISRAQESDTIDVRAGDVRGRTECLWSPTATPTFSSLYHFQPYETPWILLSELIKGAVHVHVPSKALSLSCPFWFLMLTPSATDTTLSSSCCTCEPDDTGEAGSPARKRYTFCECSLCLSRACLGKMIICI